MVEVRKVGVIHEVHDVSMAQKFFFNRFVYLDWKRLKTVLTMFFAFEFLLLFKQIQGYFWLLLKLELTHVPIVLNWELQ